MGILSQQKTALITGAAGFIGHHILAKVLAETPWNVVCLERLSYSGNLNRISEIVADVPDACKKRIRIVNHDLRSPINEIVAKMIGPVNIILHVAASSHVDRSISDPMSFVLDNVVGTCNILEYARSRALADVQATQALERFLYFSTDEVFGPAPDGVFYDEYSRYNSTNPYSATKAGGEELCVAYRNTYKLPIVITHTMNVFGERQHPEKFIPMCISKLQNGETIQIHSDATKTKAGSRHYIHAEDVAAAVLFILGLADAHWEANEFVAPKFNIVGGEEVDNYSLARMIAEIMDIREFPHEFVDFHSARPGHDLRYALSGSRLADLGWVPSDIRTKLAQTVRWSLDEQNRKIWLSLAA